MSIHRIGFPEVSRHIHTPRSYFCRDICVSIGGHILARHPEKMDMPADKEEFLLFLAPHQTLGLRNPWREVCGIQFPVLLNGPFKKSSSVIFVFSRILAKCTKITQYDPLDSFIYTHTHNPLFRKGQASKVFEMVVLPWEAKSCFTSLVSGIHQVSLGLEHVLILIEHYINS